METAAFLTFVLLVMVGLPQVLGFAAARALRRSDPRMLSWPFVAMAVVGIEGLALWLSSRPPADAHAYRCGLGDVILVAMVLISLVVNLILAPVLRAVHLAHAPKNPD